ncbi:HD-GYP domain-containing protein [Shewanella sp. D64]|uniref:HD-GYP domain-containing protein n=1 Tax=unclassified Shewanella TaxID=196818 RepID=UPI0022BA46E0|nr:MULTISPECIES: HD-GYP domain-containing protein [unclassified Shewanella]MEC4724723.1 HD-GYP domain-containing protein [Shewanella sp. D64]MEC4736483.1 HD-GYP domain-containing protein [Shewanella sp. E94]WBJ97462.1 HD-GYP domain-containing protein [Shewanella sp. MTB7]
MIVEQDISNVRVGMYVLDITYPKGKFHLTKPSWLDSERVIEGLRNKGVQRLLIDMSKTREPSVISPQIIEIVVPSFTQQITQARSVFDESKGIQKKLFHAAKNGHALDLQSVCKITDESIDMIFENPDALACVLNIRHKDEYLLEHSIAVSVLLTMFAFHMKFEREIVSQLAIGAFLHDVGKIMIPDAILNKPGKLTDKEFEIMKAHATHSINVIKKTPGVSALSLEVAALHHEKLNGEGYPNKVKSNEISIYGRMISICDIFDALTSSRCYKEGYSQVKAFSILRELSKDNQLDINLVDNFIQCMGVYPVGALVQLDSNRLAIVESHNLQDPVRPKVKAFYRLDPKQFELAQNIDLSSMQTERIVKCVRADEFNLNMDQIIEFLAHEG